MSEYVVTDNGLIVPLREHDERSRTEQVAEAAKLSGLDREDAMRRIDEQFQEVAERKETP